MPTSGTLAALLLAAAPPSAAAPDAPQARIVGRLAPAAATPAGPDDWQPLFADDFESGMGAWTVTDVGGVGAQWGDWDCWAASPFRSAACAVAGPNGIGCGQAYPHGMKAWMVHGPLGLDDPALLAARFSFLLKLDSESRFDGFFAGWSLDGQSFEGLDLDGTAQGYYAMDLTPLLGQPQVWIGFLFHSDASGTRPEGAQVDDVMVSVRRLPGGPGERPTWVISDRLDTPFSNRGTMGSSGLFTYYLWYACSPPAMSLSAARFDLVANVGVVFGVTPMNGFLAAGSFPHVELSTASCPPGPVVAASIAAFVLPAGIDLCLVPTDPEPAVWSVDCSASPVTYESDVVGYIMDVTGWSACSADSVCGERTTGLEARSWTAIRSLYR